MSVLVPVDTREARRAAILTAFDISVDIKSTCSLVVEVRFSLTSPGFQYS